MRASVERLPAAENPRSGAQASGIAPGDACSSRSVGLRTRCRRARRPLPRNRTTAVGLCRCSVARRMPRREFDEAKTAVERLVRDLADVAPVLRAPRTGANAEGKREPEAVAAAARARSSIVRGRRPGDGSGRAAVAHARLRRAPSCVLGLGTSSPPGCRSTFGPSRRGARGGTSTNASGGNSRSEIVNVAARRLRLFARRALFRWFGGSPANASWLGPASPADRWCRWPLVAVPPALPAGSCQPEVRRDRRRAEARTGPGARHGRRCEALRSDRGVDRPTASRSDSLRSTTPRGRTSSESRVFYALISGIGWLRCRFTKRDALLLDAGSLTLARAGARRQT